MPSLSDIAAQAAKSIADAAAQEKLLNDAAAAHLGFASVTQAGLVKLTSEMKRLSQESPKAVNGFIAMRKSALSFSAAAAVASAGVLKFTKSASPQLFGALGTSLELVSAKIGGELLPVLDEAIDTVQDVAEWFDTLTGGQKKLVAGLVVGIPATLLLGRAVYSLAPAAVAAATATKRLWAAMQQRPGLSAGLGAAGGVAAIAAVIYSMSGGSGLADPEKLEKSDQRATEAERRNAKKTLINSGEVEYLAVQSRAEGKSRQDRNADLAAHARKKAASVRGNPLLPNGLATELEEAALVFDRLGKNGVTSDAEVAKGDKEKAWRKQVGRASMRANAANRENAPQYSSFTEARKKLQLSALGKNPYEQKLLEEQRKHRKEENDRLDQLIQQGEARGYRFRD